MYCRRCGGEGHVKADCEGQRCRFCGEADHVASACPAPKRCSLCGKSDNLYRACPSRSKSYASILREGEDLQADLEAILYNLPTEGEGQLGVTTGAKDQEIKSASIQIGVGVKDQANGGVGDLIALSLEEKEAKEVDSEQQLSLSPAWTDLNFTEVLSNVLEDKVEQATLEPATGSARQREEVYSESEMEVSPESVSGTSRRRTRSDAGDHENREIYKHSKLENFVSQSSAGQSCRREDYDEKEKEEGAQALSGGILRKRKRKRKEKRR